MKIASWRELRSRHDCKTGMARQPHGAGLRPSASRNPSTPANREWNKITPDTKNEHSIIVKPKKAKPPMESGPTWWVGASREEFNAGIRKRFHHA